MSTNTLPENVRQSALIKALETKLQGTQPTSFDYLGEFTRLQKIVSGETGEMKTLFPQFTPHDEANHLARLFGIADKLLEPIRYEKMNTAELFLLACGLYAHDWGMAVSRNELDYLRNGASLKENDATFTPLDDESERIRQFSEQQGIFFINSENPPNFTHDQLLLYIRRTHAWRSGVRVRNLFKNAGSSVPQALEKVCQGHWLGFPELDNELNFSSKMGVLGYTVNLRAIALYVRLVDLFDISDDRTPYAIWRFVAPDDRVSQMEWEKHRALSPVTFPKFGDGRRVRIDGSTSDPEVWAELEDLRHYCEEQIAGTMDLMARHPDERHQLDIRKLDWAVSASNFKPVNIRFEFQRMRMFEILADEIYRGDSYVFLRELLQNSIDAIRMRRDLVRRSTSSEGRRREVGLGFDDAIYFDVQHKDDGDATICCRDYGIGMDEYIIRNFLSIAGTSYYQSEEFKNLRLPMDPISRFGIGILSCFMVAKKVEIETYRVPQYGAGPERLRIDIPAVDKQFRIYPGSQAFDPGTAVTVHVQGKNLKKEGPKKLPETNPVEITRLQITQYLIEIAGFVEFPIVVNENNKRTIILHPDRPLADANDFLIDGKECQIVQLSTDYNWEKIFAPQNTIEAQKYFKQESLNLRKDLKLSEFEGFITYTKLKDLSLDIHNTDLDEIKIVNSTNKSILSHFTTDFSYELNNKTGVSPSSRTNQTLSIYRDGILIPDAELPSNDTRMDHVSFDWPMPCLKVNIPKKINIELDVARRSLSGSNVFWDAPIWEGIENHLRINQFAGCEPLNLLKS